MDHQATDGGEHGEDTHCDNNAATIAIFHVTLRDGTTRVAWSADVGRSIRGLRPGGNAAPGRRRIRPPSVGATSARRQWVSYELLAASSRSPTHVSLSPVSGDPTESGNPTMADTASGTVVDQTDVGSYFVATYPPFSVWSDGAVERDALPAIAAPGNPDVALGVYLHIPFCRKRCHFCYFRVYTDKASQDVGQYLNISAREWKLYARQPAIAGRKVDFVYFGGGTPSYLSTDQLQRLVQRLNVAASWKDAEEITFECEPGTLTEKKLSVIRSLGVTRLSLGVENFDDRILELNGRAHRSPEIDRAYTAARALDFPQINIDLIAGMLGETEENWQRCIEKTLALAPDSITIYQMELPFNTTISKDLLKGTRLFSEPVANWSTKRRWVQTAFDALEAAGYTI